MRVGVKLVWWCVGWCDAILKFSRYDGDGKMYVRSGVMPLKNVQVEYDVAARQRGEALQRRCPRQDVAGDLHGRLMS
jgi:hypothetical protein